MNRVGAQPRPYRPPVDRVNRVVLTALGALCLAAGAITLLAGAGVLGDDVSARATLTSGPRDFAARHGWFWPLVGIGVGIVAALALGWLCAQVWRRRAGDLAVGSPVPAGGRTLLASGTLAAAVRGEAGELGGVRRARARFVRRRYRGPLLLLDVAADASADPASVRRRLAGEVLAHARGAAGRPDLRTQVRLTIKRPSS